ncbi:MAG: adenylyltransferase/cytidyltransferase family protein, partial [Phycisphaerales bacterium]|nr:adenylyltransferase/cytidyltransferase family protein [Phycisphaerales bacterium]
MLNDDFLNQRSSDASTARDYRRKIVGASRLAEMLAAARDGSNASRPTIVQCHGCFDIVHPGHIRYLQFARRQGDVLVVSITGDATIDKEPQRPQIPQELRAENLAALEFVDWVVIDPHPTAEAILGALRPDVYVKGREYATSEDPRFLRERDVVEAYGGRVIFSSGEVVFSSSRIIGAMGQTDELSERRLDYLCDRHDIDRSTMTRHVASIRGANVVVVGDVIVDRYVLCDARNVSSESPMMSLKALGKEDYVGGAALIALQLAAFGARPTLLTATGPGELSCWAQRRLVSAGVRVRSILEREEAPLRTRFVV